MHLWCLSSAVLTLQCLTKTILVGAFSIWVLTGCTAVSSHSSSLAENQPIPPHQGPLIHLDAKAAQIRTGFTRPRFIGIALSGGGSRAANFSAAVMENLDKFGLVRGADAISTVSGGGLAGAYYKIHGENTDWTLLREKLNTDFFGLFLQKWAAPWNWHNIVFTDYTKTNALADVFDDVLFSGVRYKELPPQGPIFLANATDITSGGSRVTLSNEYFLGELNSSLADIRIATSVATSAAFPGLFDSVTFQRFHRIDISSPTEGSVSWPLPSFVHLVDGGASDNLGVEALWDVALTRLYGNEFLTMPNKLADKPCLIILVDSNAPNTNAKFEGTADERSPLDRILNRNMFGAIDALFESRRREALIKMGLGQKQFSAYSQENFGDMEQRYVEYRRTGKFNIPVNCQTRPNGGGVCEVDYAEPNESAKRLSFQCFVWHIPLDEIVAVGLAPNLIGAPEPSGDKHARKERVKLQRLATQIETHWRLVGPADCPSKLLQDALYSGARTLVLDDTKSRFAVCDYMLSTGLITGGETCKQAFSPTTTNFPVMAEESSTFHLASSPDRSGNLPVRCIK